MSHYLSTGETFKENNNGAIYSYNKQVEITFKGKAENVNSSSQWTRISVNNRKREKAVKNWHSYFKEQKRKAKDER